MASFLDAAYRILREENRTLTAREIVSLAVQRGLLETSGATPWKTMNARLSTDILENKEQSRFMRADSGRFALASWKKDVREWIAPRRTIALFDEDILVFDRSHLRQFVPDDGLSVNNPAHDRLISLCYPMRRRIAEENTAVVQLVSAYIVQHDERVLTYRRSKRLPESRLHGVYSAIFGGHINPDDIMPLFRFSDSDQALMLLVRELYEELRFDSLTPDIHFRGLLYDPRSEVSKQHLAIVFRVNLKDRNIKIGERGFLTDPRFETKEEMLSRIQEFENWSEYLIRSEI